MKLAFKFSGNISQHYQRIKHLNIHFYSLTIEILLIHHHHPLFMYIIKVKGKAKIPDYIQLRDDSFVLVAYFRADRPLKKLEKYGLAGKEDELKTLIEGLPFGKLQKLDI